MRRPPIRPLVPWPHEAAGTLLAAALAAIAPRASAFNVYTVGGDAACGYAFIRDAIDAAASSPGEDYVWIASNRTYDDQHVVITDQDVIVEGGFTDCTQVEPAGRTRIGGTSGHSVFEIEGDSSVELGHLEITGAVMDDSHKGGGVYFGGQGALSLVGTSVHGNQTGFGGGIAMNASGAATLTLSGSTIGVNTATVEGGGIWLGGPATLHSDSTTYITANAAPNGAGGGIKLAAPAVAYISSNINSNRARTGGGIAAYASDAGDVGVNLYTTDAANPVTLYGNAASDVGGGVYLLSSRDGTAANLCAQDFAIDANTASEGAAIEAQADADGGPGANVYINAGSCAPSAPPWPAVACTTGPFCNEIADNVGGYAIEFLSWDTTDVGSTLLARRFAARRNHGFAVLGPDTSLPDSVAQLHDCLIADNTESGYDIVSYGTSGDAQLWIDNCTVANNFEGYGYTFYSAAGHTLITNSLVDDPGAQVIDYEAPSGGLVAEYDLVNNASTLAGGTDVTQGEPSFVGAADGDYHLQRTSPGVDYAPAQSLTDLDGDPRTVDLDDVPDQFGPMDLGAYEIQTQGAPSACSAADTIFCDGFDAP